MRSPRRSGFTLLELLVVVAIIAILASMLAIALPRALEKAKISRMNNAMLQLRTSLTQYYTEHNSYPPAYGYRTWSAREADPSGNRATTIFWVSTLQAALNLYGDIKLYDEFSQSFSTSIPPKPTLSLLEFAPVARDANNALVDLTSVDDQLYNGNNLPQQVQAQVGRTSRPFIYIPVNKNQLNRAKRYWSQTGDWLATTWVPADTGPGLAIQGMTFPPPNYDAFVLIGVGPGGSTFGLLDEPRFLNNFPLEEKYHMLGLRAFFLATRDMNGNGIPDFNYNDRVTNGEADAVGDLGTTVPPLVMQYFSSELGLNAEQLSQIKPNSLPDKERFNGYGPWIFPSE